MPVTLTTTSSLKLELVNCVFSDQNLVKTINELVWTFNFNTAPPYNLPENYLIIDWIQYQCIFINAYEIKIKSFIGTKNSLQKLCVR